MEIKILEEKENHFFKRKELKIVISHSGSPTPSRNDIMKNLSEKMSVDTAQIVVDYIFSKKGLAESLAKIKLLKEKPKVAETQKKEEKNETQTSADGKTNQQ